MLRRIFVAFAIVAALVVSCVKDDPCAFGECAGGSSTIDGSTDGGNVPVPPGCDPSADPREAPACVDDSYALFVDKNGSGENPGTRAAPLPSIGLAVRRHAGRPRIYVCEGTYPESVPVPDAVSIFGGFECGKWKYNGKKALVVTKGDTRPAFTITNVDKPILIADLAISGAAEANSSVAVFVGNTTDVTFRRVEMTGADVTVAGAHGNNATPVTTTSASDGNSGSPGSAKTCMCAAGGFTVGGAGGDPASPGQPALGGGQPGEGADCAGLGNGRDGKDATKGIDAPTSTDLGSLDAAGWLPRVGAPGGAGIPGQGGGGGTNGGSGGCGGCGAIGGGGGAGGGASVALVVFRSGVQMLECSLSAGRAGAGGDGGKGAAGGLGGAGAGPGAGAGCTGGRGGRGSESGAGAGGAGGVSAAILYKGEKPRFDATTTPTKSGAAGAAGKGGAATNEGVAGRAEPIIEVP